MRRDPVVQDGTGDELNVLGKNLVSARKKCARPGRADPGKS
jgi:hypothetical protein